jgi:hypothetical protein
MEQFNTELVGPLLIGLAVALKSYFFKRFYFLEKIGSIGYFIIVLIIVLPVYIFKFNISFVSLNDENAQKLVYEVLKVKPYSGFHTISNVQWKPYSDLGNLFHIKADLYKNNELYHLYMEPTCKFFVGCEVRGSKIFILKDSYKNIPLDSIEEEDFSKGYCADELIISIVKEQLNQHINKLFEIASRQQSNLNINNSIKHLSLKEFKTTHKKFSNPTNQKVTYKGSCEATMELEGNFKIIQNGKDIAPLIFKVIFDTVKKENDIYYINSKIMFDVYHDPVEHYRLAVNSIKESMFNVIKKNQESKSNTQ